MSNHPFDGFISRFGWPKADQTLPLCIAHRGASGHALENTMAAFRLAADLGAEMWEIDTQLTSDGEVVVCHDNHLLRLFGVDSRISDLTATELRQMAPQVPTFAEVAALAQETACGLYIELKAQGTGIPCWHHLRDHGQRFACLGSFDHSQVRTLRDQGCDFPLSVLVRVGDDPHTAGDAAGADILHLCWERAGDRPQDLVTQDLLARSFQTGREVVLWHEERPAILADIMAKPVLGICTDLPDLMRSTSNPKGLP